MAFEELAHFVVPIRHGGVVRRRQIDNHRVPEYRNFSVERWVLPRILSSRLRVNQCESLQQIATDFNLEIN